MRGQLISIRSGVSHEVVGPDSLIITNSDAKMIHIDGISLEIVLTVISFKKIQYDELVSVFSKKYPEHKNMNGKIKKLMSSLNDLLVIQIHD